MNVILMGRAGAGGTSGLKIKRTVIVPRAFLGVADEWGLQLRTLVDGYEKWQKKIERTCMYVGKAHDDCIRHESIKFHGSMASISECQHHETRSAT